MSKIYLTGLLSCLCLAGFGQVTFNYMGDVQTYTVPIGTTAISVDMQGATGGACNETYGGAGGRTQAILPTIQGQIIYVFVGGAGDPISFHCYGCVGDGGSGGYGGGGDGGIGAGAGSGGGGASDIRIGGSGFSNRVLVAAGGGGAGTDGGGGLGGGLTGGNAYVYNVVDSTICGFGGTQTCRGWKYNTFESFGSGESGYCGGGGGGYYGGSCGSEYGCLEDATGGGGGGSSYADSSATNVIYTPGYNSSGNGVVVITPLPICSGSITVDSAIATPVSGDSETAFRLSLAGATFPSGLTYQWQSSFTGTDSWSNIKYAKKATYTFTGIDTNTFYRCIVTCAASNSTAISNAAIVYPASVPVLLFENLKIYPNPTNKEITIENAQNCELRIYNDMVILIKSINKLPSPKETIDISTLKNGLYTIEITEPETGIKIVKKIIKM